MTKISAFEGSKSLVFSNLNEIHNFAKMVCKTDMSPKAYRNKPEEATVAIIYGMEMGLPAMASLQNIAVVNPNITKTELKANLRKELEQNDTSN